MKNLRVLVSGILLGVAGCAAGPNYHLPKADTPAEFAAKPAAATAAPIDLASWWRSLNDPELNSLVDRAIASNPTLEIALTRLQQARTYEAVILSAALPEAEADAGAGRGTGRDLTRGRVPSALGSADNSFGLQHINTVAGFDAMWELDVFGKFRREYEAVRADTQAAADARSAVLTSLIADVVRGYVDLRGLQVRAGVLRQATDVLRESLRIVSIRFQRGITNELDVALATRELDTLLAQIAPVDAQVEAAENAIAVLLGQYPEQMVQELSKPDLIPTMPAAAAAGEPVDLLKRRPDVEQAERELAAATARIGVATADLFPQVALVGAIGAQSQNWGSTPTIGKHIWSFGPGAIWPLLDFGALDAQVDIAHLEAHAALINYRRTILNAVQQVDSAVTGYAAQQQQLSNLSEALVAAQRAVDVATERYNRGLTDYLNVVDAERQYYDLQEGYVAAQVTQGEQFVQLYKSLGGGWQNYQAVPEIRRPQPVIIAAFRRAIEKSTP